MKFFAMIAAFIVVFAVTAPAMAKPQRSTTVQVSNDSPSVGDKLVFTGCGYEPGVGVSVTVSNAEATTFFGSLADSNGCFSTALTEDYTVWVKGTHSVSTYQSSGKKPDASLTFTVV